MTVTPQLVDPGAAASQVPARRVVVAAIDDDGNAGRVLDRARKQATLLGLPIRVVHVWTEHGRTSKGFRLSRRDRVAEADRLLATAVRDHLPPEEAAAAERQILHDHHPARALKALVPVTGVLIVAASSHPQADLAWLGATTRRLVGETTCPLMVVPAAEDRLTGSLW